VDERSSSAVTMVRPMMVMLDYVCPTGGGGSRCSFAAAAAVEASMPLWKGLCGMPEQQ
jgi:hypothetical protein